MAAQLDLAIDNLEAVLTAADMTLANVVRLNVYTTDFDALVRSWARLTDRFGSAEGDRFVTSLLGVTRLFTRSSSSCSRQQQLTDRPSRRTR